MGIEGMWRKFLDRAKSNPVEDYDANAYEELRHVAYEVVFGGKAANVVVEAAVTPPFPVGVHLFNEPPKLSIIMPGGASATPTQPRNWTTLATMGMSNERMPNPPAHVRPEMGRVELLFHVSWRALDATPDLIHFVRYADVFRQVSPGGAPLLAISFPAPLATITLSVTPVSAVFW
jgi:hypothetical protein